MTEPAHPPLIQALLQSQTYPHPAENVELIETHISWVLLAGPYCYKIKKPVSLGFLDFSMLELRRRFSLEELRLNRRLSADLYLGLVEFTGAPATPRFGPPGEVFEVAVQMRRFDDQQRLDRLAARGELTVEQIQQLAAEVARFHALAAVAGSTDDWGLPDRVIKPVRDNLDQLAQRDHEPHDQARIARLRSSVESAFADLRPTIQARRDEGFVREGHGDLHLANLVLLKGRVRLFDCLEFSPELRWIDCMNDLAFAVMDLIDRRQGSLAARLLNAYLEITGDYGGLRVLPFYLSYRAAVRAVVASIRREQPGQAADSRLELQQEMTEYLALAERSLERGAPSLIVMHGLSGSGKSVVASELAAVLGGIRLRSDVERKRIQSHPDYSAAGIEQVYARLETLAEQVLAAGYTPIIDATCLVRRERERFRALAARRRVPCILIQVQASEPILRERIVRRSEQGQDPSDATLEVFACQCRALEALDAEELAYTVTVRTDGEWNLSELTERVQQLHQPPPPP